MHRATKQPSLPVGVLMRSVLFVALLLSAVAASGCMAPELAPVVHDVSAAPATSGAGGAAASALRSSGIEDQTGLQYQNDAGVHGDAPDTCETVDDRRALLADEGSIDAMLVERDDEADVFAVPIDAAFTGERLRFDLLKTTGADLFELAFDIVDAACGFSVFDPDADIYHPERNAPSEPFNPQTGQQTYDYAMPASYTCDATEWKIMLRHLNGLTVDSLYIQWSNGDYEYVAPETNGSSQVAKFITSRDVEHTITRIAASMPTGFPGTIHVAHGPCGLTDASDIQAPSSDANGGEFTVAQSGEYVLLVTMTKGAIEKATGIAPPVRCHPACLPGAEAMGFKMELFPASAA